jgi:hypothetical protein
VTRADLVSIVSISYRILLLIGQRTTPRGEGVFSFRIVTPSLISKQHIRITFLDNVVCRLYERERERESSREIESAKGLQDSPEFSCNRFSVLYRLSTKTNTMSDRMMVVVHVPSIKSRNQEFGKTLKPTK